MNGFNSVKEAYKGLNPVVKQHEQIIKEENGTVKKQIQQTLKNGEIITKFQEIVNKRTQAIKNHTSAIKVDQAMLDSYGKKMSETIKLNAELATQSSKQVYGTKNNNISVNTSRDGNVTSYQTKNNIQQTEKDVELQNKKKEALAYQLNIYKQLAQIKFDNLKNASMSGESKAALEKWLADVNKLTVATPKLTQQLKQMDVNLRRVSSGIKSSAQETNSFGSAIGKTLTKIGMWAGTMSLFYAPFRGLKEAVSLIYSVDSQMTQLKRVMDEFTDFEGMLSRQTSLAKELGRSITDVGESMIEFARMGYNENQTMDLSKVAVLAQNISELTPTEGVNAITSAMIAFNIEADRSITIVDKLNQIDNNFSVTTQQLAVGMQKAGATAKQFGVDLDTLLGYETAVMSATRETGSVVGNSLRTIFSRITTMDEAASALKGVGVSIKELSGDVKPVQDILAELQSRWSSLTNEQQQNIGVTIAGRNQLNRFLALMSNWETGLEATEEAMHSQGSAVGENAKYMESLEAKTNIMKASWQELALTMGSAVINDSLIGLIKAGTGIANVFASIVEKVGLLPITFGGLGIAVYALSGSFRTATVSMITTVRAIVGLPPSAAAASAGIKGLTISLAGLKAGIRGVLAATGVGLVLTAIGFAAEWAINKLSGAKKEIQDTTEALTTLSDQIAVADRLKELSTEYSALAKKVTLTAEEKIKLSKVESELQSKYDLSLSSLGEEGQAYKDNQGLIETKISLLEEEIRLKRESASLEFRGKETSVRSDIKSQKKDMEDAVKASQELQKKYEEFIHNRDNNIAMSNENGYWSNMLSPQQSLDPSKSGDLKALNMLGELLANAITDANETMNTKTNDYKKSINIASEGIKGEFRNFIDGMESSGKKIEPATRTIFDSLAQLDSENGLRLDTKQLQEFFNLLNTPNVKSIEDVNKVFEEKLPKSISGVGEQLKLIRDAFMKIQFGTVSDEASDGLGAMGDEADNTKDKILTLAEAMNALDSGLDGSDEQMTEFSKSISAAKEDIDLLNNAQNELTENGHLSSKTIKEVSEKYTDFIKVTGLSKDAIYAFIKATKEEKNVVIQSEMDKTKTLIGETKKRIEAIRDEMNAKMALVNVNSADDLNAEKLGLRAFQDAQKLLAELNTKYGILSNTLVDFQTNTNKTTKDNEKLTDSHSDSVEVLTELQKRMEAIDNLLDAESRKRSRLRKDSKEYQDSLRKENDLLKEKIKLGKEGIEDPSKLVSTKVTTTTKTNDSSSSPSVNSGSSSIDNMLSNALGLQGKFTYKQVSGKFKGTYEEFVKGATSDCSQFVQEMFDEFLNINLPRTAAEQAKQGVSVSKADLQAGDLVFFNTTGKDNSHVGIYTGNGKFVQMGNSGLKEQDLNSKTWTEKYTYNGAKRVASSFSSTSSGKTTKKDGNTTVKTDSPTQKDMIDAVEAQIKQNNDSDDQIYQNNLFILESIKEGFDRKIQEQEDFIYASKRTQEKLDPNSVEWRKENEKQVNSKGNIQGIQHEAKTKLQAEMKKLGIESNEWDDILKKLSSDWLDVQSEKYALLIENFSSQIDSTKQRISDLDNLIEQSKNRMSKFDIGSPEYNKELNIQIELTKKQNKENENLKKSLETLANSTKLDPATRKKFKEMLDELNLKDYTSDIKDLNAELIASKATPLTKEIDELNHKLDVSKATLKGFKEGTEEYNIELKKQLTIIDELVIATKKLKDYAETQSKNEELSASVREDYKKQVQELTMSLYDYADSLKSIREEYADNVIEKYKKMLQEQQKLRNAAYDKEREAEDARHEARMSNLDDEMSKFEEAINAQSKSFDREVAAEDYADQLAKLQKEKAELDSKFSSKLLDDSLEGKLARADLQKEIDAKQEEITKLQRDREITIRKEGLSDQLEDRKAAVDKEKKLEDDKNKSIIKGIEANKKLNDEYYDGLLNDEQYFYNMKQNLMSGDTIKIQNELNIVQAAYDAFFKELEKNAAGYSAKIKENLKYSISLDKDYSNNFPTSDGSGNASGGNSENPTPTPSKSQKQSDWEKYLSNKQKAEQLKTDMKTLMTNSSEYKSKQSQFLALQATNEALRKQYTDFPDGSYEQLKNKVFSAETGGMTPANIGKEGKFLLAHEKELVLNKFDTSKLLEVVGMVREFPSNLSNLSKMLSPNVYNKNTTTSSPQISIRIDKVEGTKEGAKIVTDSIEKMFDRKFRLGQ
ncbi:phage tail tape measure protein [Paenibacillus odorifer]|uniref:phage tail tape measure protein n=1 Tax=Paenibacillus odorifer TaxID=189426 RepID=UPI00096E4E8E|nr:phage tail tape measure protein [Paenibacillus odorifer]OMD75291.1 phage tail tape measure protein [Paenibacillus odorifer]